MNNIKDKLLEHYISLTMGGYITIVETNTKYSYKDIANELGVNRLSFDDFLYWVNKKKKTRNYYKNIKRRKKMYLVKENDVTLGCFETLPEANSYFNILNGKENGLSIIKIIEHDHGLFVDEVVIQ